MAADISKRDFQEYSDRIILIHGTKDEIVPIEPVRAFAADNHIPFVAIENADHRFIDAGKTEAATIEVVRYFWST